MPELSGHNEFLVAGWQVDPATLRMARGEHTVKLEPRVMQVLVFLAQQSGEVVTREALEASVWKGRVVGYDAVANTIIKLRKAFGDNSRQPHVIETISKTGYRLIAEVTLPTREPGTPTADANETRASVRLPKSKPRLFIWVAVGLLVLIAIAVALASLKRKDFAFIYSDVFFRVSNATSISAIDKYSLFDKTVPLNIPHSALFMVSLGLEDDRVTPAV